MPRRVWLSAGLLAAGAALLATARLAGASTQSSAVFRVGMEGASVQIDPQLSYISTGWWLEYATAAKLYNWTDRGSKFVPEVASRFTVSNRGRTYTFFLRKGFRFSDGSAVTAKNFAYAIDRTANKELASPGAWVITDPHGTNIVGAQAVNAGTGTHVSGVAAKGKYQLVVRLTKPDGAFILKLTMPFFQATSTTLPLTHEVEEPYPSAGPYAFTRNDVNRLTSIRRNQFYGGGRPHRLDGVDIRWGVNEEDAFDQVLANQLDETAVGSNNAQEVANLFGVNKTRFWSKPTNCISWLLFNNSQGLLQGNAQMRKAINWVVDRTAYAAQSGPYAGAPWTHLLAPGSPGSIGAKKLQPYATTARIGTARKLARGHFRNGKVVIGYPATSAVYPGQAEVVRRGMIDLGFKPQNITVTSFNCSFECFPPADWNIITGGGWCPESPDPLSFLVPFLPNGSVYPLELAGKYQRKVAAASKLVGAARLRAFGKLDLEITNRVAPVAVMKTYNNRYLFSNRVDRRSLAYGGVYQNWSIPALALK